LFAAGTFAAIGSLNIWYLAGLLMFAAVLGDTVIIPSVTIWVSVPTTLSGSRRILG